MLGGMKACHRVLKTTVLQVRTNVMRISKPSKTQLTSKTKPAPPLIFLCRAVILMMGKNHNTTYAGEVEGDRGAVGDVPYWETWPSIFYDLSLNFIRKGFHKHFVGRIRDRG